MEIHRGVFLSDLHQFSSRCNKEFDLSPVYQYDLAEDCIVLGGDIFDFKWSTLGDMPSTFRASIEWLQAFLKKTGQSRVVYLSGNHDCHPEFEKTLQDLAAREPRFQWEPFTFRAGDILFLHGDILDAKGPTQDDLMIYRRQFHHPSARPKIMHRLYDLAVALRIHLVVPQLVRTKHATCQKLLAIVKSQVLAENLSLSRIIFGHTHAPIQDHWIGDVRFDNPGAMLRHARYCPVHFSCSGN